MWIQRGPIHTYQTPEGSFASIIQYGNVFETFSDVYTYGRKFYDLEYAKEQATFPPPWKRSFIAAINKDCSESLLEDFRDHLMENGDYQYPYYAYIIENKIYPYTTNYFHYWDVVERRNRLLGNVPVRFWPFIHKTVSKRSETFQHFEILFQALAEYAHRQFMKRKKYDLFPGETYAQLLGG